MPHTTDHAIRSLRYLISGHCPISALMEKYLAHQRFIETQAQAKKAAAATPPINAPSHGLPNKLKAPAATHAPLPTQSDTGNATPQSGPESPCTTAFPM